ncbi:MAG: ABC transporter ATP-binding protein [Opitutaceae bacterium]|nr:ABC transporter ATP-binding protein [Cytophagales bacterium]
MAVIPAIHIENLHFHYEKESGTFLNGLSLTIPENDRFGLFGPNGAGKSTLMNLMTGILKPELGTIELFGTDLQQNHKKAVKKIFGFVPQDFSFYNELSPLENLEFFGAWYGMSAKETRMASDELLEVMNLTSVRNKSVGQFSGGMKRRVNLAIGVMHKPKILFLDEPTVGVDVQTRHAIIEFLLELNKKGMTLVYTSHQLSEAESLCENIALMDEGKIIAQNKLSILCEEYKEEGLEGLFLNLTGKAYRDM